jgi:hypothetical protein
MVIKDTYVILEVEEFIEVLRKNPVERIFLERANPRTAGDDYTSFGCELTIKLEHMPDGWLGELIQRGELDEDWIRRRKWFLEHPIARDAH